MNVKPQKDRFEIKVRREKGSTPRMAYWGGNCEYDVLTDVLLGPVEHFRWLKTSSVSKKSFRRKSKFDLPTAVAQYNEVVSAYKSANVNVHCLTVDHELPYQIFARDSSVMTPYGAIITNMSQPWRKGENFRAIETYKRLNIPIYDFVTAGTFEGGDLNVIEPNCALIGWEGPEGRSEENAALQLKSWLENEGWEIMIADIDPFFVHIDIMVVMLAEKLAAVCTETTDEKILSWLKSKKIRIIPVPFKETMNLGCNVVALGEDRVLLPYAASSLKDALRAEGFTIYDPDVGMITQGGGGLHCMCQSLRRIAK
ncbi:MAG: arginine deiminase family protein [Pseudomonadota bacterium]|nr:arginine deiminase family protein [Pseudomonadota bacterium]